MHETGLKPAACAVALPRCAAPHGGLGRQFGRPQGWLGWLVGKYMAANNGETNSVLLEVLDVQPGDEVLEIGFGPGNLLTLLTERASGGHVCGVDWSDLMVRQAAGRNRPLVAQGRLELHRAGVSELPFEGDRFDKACTANTFHHWPDPANDLVEVRRVLRVGGVLAVCVRVASATPRRMSPPGFSSGEIAAAEDLLRGAGFRHVRCERRQLSREIACLIAEK